MDIEEVETAGIQTHDHLTGDPGSSGVGGGGGGSDSWACYLLRRGWELTRKAAIVGAAATAAPVVAPPLIVLSAAGVALSVPFAAYLASLAATNHLMGALLRSCYPPPTQQCYYRQEDHDLEREFLDASEEYAAQGAPAFGHLDLTRTEQGEENEGDTLLLLPPPPDHGVSEALAPTFADDEVEEEEGGISALESGQEPYASIRGDETEPEEHTAVEGRETPLRGVGVSTSAMPLFSQGDNQVQTKVEGKFSVLDSGQQPFQPENWNEKGDAVYSGNKEEDGEVNKSTKDTVSHFPESRVPASDDNVVQNRGEGEFYVQSSGQQSFQSKNWNEKEEDGISSEENKSVDETLLVPTTSGGEEDIVYVIQEKGEGEFSEQNLGQYSLLSSMGGKEEQGMTMDENKSTENMPPPDNVVSESPAPVFHGEDNVVQSDEGFEGTVQGVVEEANSNTDTVMGEVAEVQVEIIAIAEPEVEVPPPSNLVAHHSPADPVTGEILHVQVDIVAAAAPESEVLPLSSLAALESQAAAETAHGGEVKNEKGMAMEEKKSTYGMPPRDFNVSESPAPVFHGKDNVVHSVERFQGAVQGVVEVGDRNTDIGMREVAEVQLQINSGAAPDSEVLPPSNRAEENKTTKDMPPRETVISESSVAVLGGEDDVAKSKEGFEVAVQEVVEAVNSHTGLVMGEVADVQLEIIAIAATESEVLHPRNLAASEAPADPVTGQTVDVEVETVAAAEPESEVLSLSSLPAGESQAAAETADVSEVIGITVMTDIVRDFDDVNEKGVGFVPVASVRDSEDVMSSGSTTYLSTVEEEAFGSRVAAGGEAHYTEEQLREQLDTIRTITGYGAVPSSTLEGELAGLYIFVGVEPAVASGDTSDRLMELNTRLRFLKSIIGVD